MTRRTRIKELETSEVALARLRAQRIQLDAEIARLEEYREADVLDFVVDAAKRLKIAQLPAASILAALEQLAQSAREDRSAPNPDGARTETADDPRQGLVEVFVRLTRNTSAANREALKCAGCAGMDAPADGAAASPPRPWTTCARPSATVRRGRLMPRLLRLFRTARRMSRPSTLRPRRRPLGLAEEPGQIETVAPSVQSNVPAAARLLTSPFCLPPRRPAPT